MRIAMRHFCAAISGLVALAAMATVPARATEATFERDLAVSGRVDLAVATGSGSIHLTSGPAGRIHIFARVKSGWDVSDEIVQEIAAHPPIEQTGNIVRIGTTHRNLGNISIDYEIQAPPDAYLDAAAGSGNVIDDGVGANAKLSTGSGSIHATGLEGGFTVQTGSGNIDATQTGTGDVRAETGSGSIELKNLHGGLQAGTGSGNVKVDGAPAAPWRIHTGSGSIELSTGNAGLTLDASTGSGGIHTDRDIVSQGTMDRHHVKGAIGGGGPMVHVDTGSGNIRIHS
jgi:Putative adhesin